MEAFNDLQIKTVHPTDLSSNQHYNLIKLQFVETHLYGKRCVATIIVDGEIKDLFLPDRFKKLSVAQIEEVNSGDYYLQYIGAAGKSHNYILIPQ